ncbi:MAG: hypothetical protein JXL80_10000 [Planctomycetes bacterium]|nr:hypothetical protein [Planctomycetota bacterium]
MSTASRPRGAARAFVGDELCENRAKTLNGLVWRVAGGLATILVTVALAAAAHISTKADRNELRCAEARTRELEQAVTTMQTQLAEIRAVQQHIREDVTYIRKTLDEEKKR